MIYGRPQGARFDFGHIRVHIEKPYKIKFFEWAFCPRAPGTTKEPARGPCYCSRASRTLYSASRPCNEGRLLQSMRQWQVRGRREPQHEFHRQLIRRQQRSLALYLCARLLPPQPPVAARPCQNTSFRALAPGTPRRPAPARRRKTSAL